MLNQAGQSWGANLGSWREEGEEVKVALRAGYNEWTPTQLEEDSLAGPAFSLEVYSVGTFSFGAAVALKLLSADELDDTEVQAGFLLRLHMGDHVALAGGLGASFDWIDADGDSKTGLGVYGNGGLEVCLAKHFLLYGEYQATGVTFGDEAKINGQSTLLNKENLEGPSVNVGIGYLF